MPYFPIALSCLVFQSAPNFPRHLLAKGRVETESISCSSSRFSSVCGGTRRRIPVKPVRPPLTLLLFSQIVREELPQADIAFICLHRLDKNHLAATKGCMYRALRSVCSVVNCKISVIFRKWKYLTMHFSCLFSTFSVRLQLNFSEPKVTSSNVLSNLEMKFADYCTKKISKTHILGNLEPTFF